MLWQARTYKRQTTGWKFGLVGLAVCALILAGGVTLDSALGVALDGGDGTVILLTSNHLSNDPSDDELVSAKAKPKRPEINLALLGDGNDDNREEAFFYPPSSTLTSVRKTLTAASDFKDRRTAITGNNDQLYGHEGADMVQIQIISDFGDRDPGTLSAAKLENFNPSYLHFAAFVKAVTEHLAAKLAQEKLGLDSPENQKRSLLQFLGWGPAYNAKDRPLYSSPPLEVRAASVCRLSSPWIDLVIEQKPVPWVRGVVRWNMRQLLVDQAVLAGTRDVPLGVAWPLEMREYRQYYLEYLYSEIIHEPLPEPKWSVGKTIY
ncbi:hypothetical protein FACS189460_4480 [Deltaproteobacteria bacterium]|nr:hypothetical protein FACS189460_4480 [Deltaproteobacteria bacterium]